MEAPDRATTPMVRRRRGGPREPVSWEEALDTFVSRMRQVQADHGPDSVAFLSTGQMPSEEMALLGALGRFGMGIRHCDGNTRQCMATAVVAYKQAFGFDAPPYTYARSEEHTSELQSLMRISYAVFCLKKKKHYTTRQ